MALLELRESGLYCAAGDFYLDPWAPVERAIVSHAHSAHAGCGRYLTARGGGALVAALAGPEAAIEGIGYSEPVTMGGVRVSLHPAGHMLGSAQVRLEQGGEVWVFSGDYQLAADPTCAPFAPVRCHTFVTEATFGLPVFRWPALGETMAEVHAWWRANREAGKASLLFVHPLGLAQRVLAALDPAAGPIRAHETVARFNRLYREQGVALPPAEEAPGGRDALVAAPPSCHGTPWEKQFGSASTAFVSGWMRIRGTRRRRSLDRGFVLSGHADWPALLGAIEATGAETVWVTHGYRAPLVRWLEEHGRRALAIDARFEEADW
ncbi:MAG: ligase-associated DNA damage response exonuclease [Acidobacteriia bacterium]|nr:ligase-associated DNA damage response exonuclease [Terriglobia bacterium]